MKSTLKPAHWFPDLSERSEKSELMDDLLVDPHDLECTLADFKIINFLFTRVRTLARRVLLRDALQRGAKEVTLLDIGSGACDFAQWFVSDCRRLGIKARATCLDHDARAILYARRKIGNDPAIEIVHADWIRSAAGDFRADYVTANHFLHHLPGDLIPEQIGKMTAAATRAVLANDLLRSPVSYFLFSLFAGLFFKKGYTYADGRLSIRRGFRPREMDAHIADANLSTQLRTGTILPGHIYIYGTK